MKKQWFAACVVAGFATTAVLGAQGSPSPRNTPPTDAAVPPGIQKPEPTLSVQPKADTVTITGCIQDVPMASATAARPAIPVGGGEPTAVASTKSYYLNNTKMAADAGRDRPAIGTSGLAVTGYRLEGDNAVITTHLNHQVRVVGVVQQSDAAPGSKAAGPTLKVESVTMVAATCEPVK